MSLRVVAGTGSELNKNVPAAALPALGLATAVPTGEWWALKRLLVTYVATAGVGSRDVNVYIRDAAGLVKVPFIVGQTVTASQTQTYLFTLFILGAQETVEKDMIDEIIMYDGWDIFVEDTADIDVLDTVEFQMDGEILLG